MVGLYYDGASCKEMLLCKMQKQSTLLYKSFGGFEDTLTSRISAGCPCPFPSFMKGFLSNPAAVASAFLPSVESPPSGPKSHCVSSPLSDLTCARHWTTT